MNTKSTRRSQKQLLKRKPVGETSAAPLPEIPVLDCGVFGEQPDTPVLELNGGTFDPEEVIP